MFDVPNLDGLSTDPKDLFEASNVLSRLACIAEYKGKAMELRAKGDIEAAESFERSADYQYKRLPEWAKW